jgi:hypothetical protein
MALEVAIARSKAMEILEPLRVDIATLDSGYEEAVKIATRAKVELSVDRSGELFCLIAFHGHNPGFWWPPR